MRSFSFSFFALIFLFVFPAGAQSTYAGSALISHLGKASAKVFPNGSTAVFYFQNGATIQRQCDGQSSLVELLEKGLNDGIRRGACKGVAIDNVAVTPAPREQQGTAQATTTTTTQPPPLLNPPGTTSSGNKGGSISLPDSAAVAENLQHAKEKVSGWRGRLWSTALPIWEFVMWIFNSVIVLLICFGGLCRYVAKTAAQESRVNRKGKVVLGNWIAGAHQNASAMLLLITWVIAIFFLIDAFMWLVYLDLPVWLLVVLWFPILWFAEKLTGWIVPNLRGDGGNYPQA